MFQPGKVSRRVLPYFHHITPLLYPRCWQPHKLRTLRPCKGYILLFFYYGGDGMSSREWQTVMMVWQLCSELCRRITAGWSDLRASSESSSQSVQPRQQRRSHRARIVLYCIILYHRIILYQLCRSTKRGFSFNLYLIAGRELLCW